MLADDGFVAWITFAERSGFFRSESVANVRRRADETVRQVCDMIADLSHPEDTEEASQDDEEADDL
jgi:hypothetical protein